MSRKTNAKFNWSYVGTAEVLEFARRHHQEFRLPGEEIFAVVQDADTPDVIYGLVSERDRALDDEGCRFVGDLGISDAHFAELQRILKREALECGIKPPFAATLMTESGVFSVPVRVVRRNPKPVHCAQSRTLPAINTSNQEENLQHVYQ